MRRPPDKDGQASLSERDVDSSNATLNTFFGGARQKSWMVGAGTPVRPTPRPNVPKTYMPQVASTQRNNSTILPSPAPSNDSSPVISNDSVNGIMQDHHRGGINGRSALNAMILNDRAASAQRSSGEADRRRLEESSPTREEIQIESPLQLPQDQTTSAGMNINIPSSSSREIPTLPPIELLSPELQHSTISLQNMQSHTAQRASSGGTQTQGNLYRPPVSGLGLVDPQARAQGSEQNSFPGPEIIQNPTPGVTQREPIPRQPNDRNQLLNPIPATILSTPVSQGAPLPSPRRINDPIQLPSPIPAPIQIASLSATGPQGAGLPSPGAPSSYQPPRRQRSQPAPMPSLKSRIALIEAHLNSVGGEGSLNTALEKPRFQLLMEACGNEDPFYVALHQVFLVWDTNRDEILRIQEFPNVNILRAAFQIITTLIKGNDALAPNHKNWFARFPSPLSDLLRTSEPYRRTVADVGVFLDKLARIWSPLTQECVRRGYPVLVDELVNRLGLLSPILQGVAFTATRRNIGIREEPTSTRMDELFKRDQYEHKTLAARYNTARPPTANEISARNEALANEYLKLHTHLMQHRQASASMAGSNTTSRVTTPIVPNNVYVQNGASQSSMVSRPEQSVPQQASWVQNVSSPDPSGNWQLTRTTGSPNPSAVPGRPASVGPHQLHANTPSPTMFQNLSMHSPVQQNFQFAPILRSSSGSVQSGQPNIATNSGVMYHPSSMQNVQSYPQAQYISQPQAIASPTTQQHQINAQHQQQVAVQHNTTAHQQNQMSAQQLQWQQQRQQQILMQQRQLQQQNNRATHLRRDPSISVDPQRGHSRRSSISSNGRRTPSTNSQLPPPHTSANPPLPPDQDIEGIMAYSRTAPSQRPLVPPLGFQHDRAVDVHSRELNALHQALLRSPRLSAMEFESSEKTQNDPAFRHYQAIRSLALGPLKLLGSPISKYEFKIPHSDHVHIPRDVLSSNGQTPIREFRRGTLQYRIRCIQMNKSAVECSFPDWVVADTVWPESACLEMNKTHLEMRRKSNHTKDLPIDVTQLARSQGVTYANKITFSVTKNRKILKDSSYFLGVEVVEILGHQQILDMCQANRLPAADTLNKIKKSLAPPPSDDDDDFAMVVSDISIDLTDPWMSKIFNIPVRGSSCLHRECFDLETFLLTRNSKMKRPQQPCMVDTWKCPFCNRDARPWALRIDGFLVDVRASLAEQGRLDARAIWVSADGSWRPKIEKRKATGNPDESDYSSDGDGASRRKAPKQENTGHSVQVISLVDD